jgi:hypothetical protein
MFSFGCIPISKGKFISFPNKRKNGEYSVDSIAGDIRNDDKKAKEPEFRVGQTLLLRVYKIPKGLSRKLPDKSDGPYLITELGPNHTYKLLNCATNKTIKSLINARAIFSNSSHVGGEPSDHLQL